MLFFAYKYQDEYYRTPDKLTKQRNIDMEENWPIAKNIYTILFIQNLWSISSYGQSDSCETGVREHACYILYKRLLGIPGIEKVMDYGRFISK